MDDDWNRPWPADKWVLREFTCGPLYTHIAQDAPPNTQQVGKMCNLLDHVFPIYEPLLSSLSHAVITYWHEPLTTGGISAAADM